MYTAALCWLHVRAICKTNKLASFPYAVPSQVDVQIGCIWIERVSPRAPHKQRHGPLTSLGARCYLQQQPLSGAPTP